MIHLVAIALSLVWLMFGVSLGRGCLMKSLSNMENAPAMDILLVGVAGGLSVFYGFALLHAWAVWW